MDAFEWKLLQLLITRSTWLGQHAKGHGFKDQGRRQHFPTAHFSGRDMLIAIQDHLVSWSLWFWSSVPVQLIACEDMLCIEWSVKTIDSHRDSHIEVKWMHAAEWSERYNMSATCHITSGLRRRSTFLPPRPAQSLRPTTPRHSSWRQEDTLQPCRGRTSSLS